jgi:hypothetical protein
LSSLRGFFASIEIHQNAITIATCRTGAHQVLHGNTGIYQSQCSGINGGTESTSIIGQYPNDDFNLGLWVQMQEQSSLHGPFEQMRVFYKTSIRLWVGNASVG